MANAGEGSDDWASTYPILQGESSQGPMFQPIEKGAKVPLPCIALTRPCTKQQKKKNPSSLSLSNTGEDATLPRRQGVLAPSIH